MSLPLRVLVCDDELVARARATRLLGALPGVEVVAQCSSGGEVLDKLGEEDVDVVVLDIMMPGLSGIETALRMPEHRPYIIFLTAHPEHALEAFDVGATDYVLKPVDEARLERALDRARKMLDAPVARSNAPPATLARLAIATRAGVVLLSPDEITHATFDGQLVTVHTKERSVLSDGTLQEIEDKLARDHFERVHRRAIVNLLHVERLEPLASGGYVARIAGGKSVEVSRMSARRLRRRLGIS